VSASEVAALAVSIVSAVVAVAAYITARQDPRPRIRGSVNAVLHAPLVLPDEREITAVMVHVTLTNARPNPTHLVSYDLDINRGRGLERLPRLRRLEGFPALRAGDRLITLTDDVLLYRPPRPVEYGAAQVGVVVYYVEERGLSEQSISVYRFSVQDVFGQRFEMDDRRDVPNPGGFDVVELFELAGAKVEAGQSA
jgi:hypothetical protein